ncbi:hypothetical protein [Demequina sp. NBRC 110052]|uniref:hypothetical protein n=1 Tax=Demequina sp. NBRC 110052 TaxID=1570341 RepID=UPI000A0377AF|nr:hypothetical protein [Demequina sp. NBRC 110052]
MVSVKRRLIAAVAVAASLALSACAPGNGVVAQGAGVSVTTADVSHFSDGLDGLAVVADQGWALTLAVIEDAVVTEASDAGYAWSDDELAEDVAGWFSAIGYEPAVPDEAVFDAIRTAKSLGYLASTEDGSAFIAELAAELETDLDTSPRYGDFSAQLFLDSVTSAAQTAEENVNSIGSSVYVVFVAVSGYDLTTAPAWFGAPNAGPAPADGSEPDASVTE